MQVNGEPMSRGQATTLAAFLEAADFVAARVVAALIAAGPRPGRTSFLKALRAGDGLEATARRVDLAYPRISAQIPIAFRPLDADPPAKTARTP